MKSMKYFSVLILFAFIFNANAAQTSNLPTCGACQKTITDPNANCPIAKGFHCDPRLKMDCTRTWYLAGPKQLRGAPTQGYMGPPPGHAWPPCGACKKPTKGPGKDTPCEVAKGYTCNPGLQKGSNGEWYKASPPDHQPGHMGPPPHPGHHPGHMGPPPPPCEKCGQPCPPPHIHKKCSQGGECHPGKPPHGHMPPPPPFRR